MPRILTTAATLAALAIPLAASAAHADYLGAVGRPGAGAGSLGSPWGVAAAPDGRIYVTDTPRGRVSVYDSSGVPERSFGSLSGASGVAVGPGGVYVVERTANRVARFDRDGTPRGTFGAKGVGNGQFVTPEGVALSGTDVLVSSQYRFQRFTAAGTFVDGHGGAGAAPGDFEGLRGIAAGTDGLIYTTETTNHRVQRFSSSFDLETTWGQKGTLDGQLSYPPAVAVDTQGESVWVSDLGSGRVQRFGVGGQFRASLPKLPADAPGAIIAPAGVATDCRGTLYVADTVAARVQRYGEPETAVAGNLLRNGGFEEGGASCDTSPAAAGAGPGWTGSGATAVHYGAAGGFPVRAEGDASGGGQSFLAGGPGTARTVVEQTVDVRDQALDIDDGRRLARLSGRLGGYAGQEDQARVEASYLDGAGRELGATRLGPVTAADRAGTTRLLAREAATTVPRGTRTVRVRVTLTRAPGTGGYDDASVDRLALTLTPQRPAPAGSSPGSAPRPGARAAAPRLRLRRIGIGGVLATGRLALTVSCSRSCGVRATLSQAGRTRASATLRRGAGPRRLVLRLSPAARRALRHAVRAHGSVRVRLSVRATDAASRRATATRVLALRT